MGDGWCEKDQTNRAEDCSVIKRSANIYSLKNISPGLIEVEAKSISASVYDLATTSSATSAPQSLQ